MRRWLAVLLLAVPGVAAAIDWREHLTLVASDRARGEFVNWFAPPPGLTAPDAERYDFFGNQLRLGFRLTFPHVQLAVDMQDTRLVNLPADASLPPPQGNLGTGANYYANTRRRDQGEPFLKQGALTLRGRGVTLTGGRFDYRDGLETVPSDPTLLFLKRQRIAERLVGPFDFTHVTRSFDGARLAYDRPGWNDTAFLVVPTVGGFDISANREIDEILVAGNALTWKRVPGWRWPTDVRLFWLYYDDQRQDAVKVDNRPLDVRERDHEPIAMHTFGTHGVTAIDLGPGTLDALVWAAFQVGDWGALDQRSWAYAVEVGYQLPRVPLAPWLRVGLDRTSGDDDPNDDTHGTFFQMLPTARIYAQLPFFNLMNIQDVFTMLILRPHDRVMIRTDWHLLDVTEGRDLWYQGGGATNDDVFGYAGAPANGRHRLAQLVDIGITWQAHDRVTLGGYYGHAFGGGVVRQTYAGEDVDYGFVEVTLRY